MSSAAPVESATVSPGSGFPTVITYTGDITSTIQTTIHTTVYAPWDYKARGSTH